MKKKTILILLVIVASLYFIWIAGLWKMVNGFGGSYPYAETWDLQANEARLIEIIKEIKDEHPELLPPEETSSTTDTGSYWCYINFYYADTKELVHTWLREDWNPQITTLAFTNTSFYHKKINPTIDSLSIKLGIDTSSHPENAITIESRTINRDYGYFANKNEIKKFEKLILDRIIEKINQKKKE